MATNKEYTFEEGDGAVRNHRKQARRRRRAFRRSIIQQFQEGMTLSKFCHDRLQHIEKQMETILREDGTLEPFSVQEEE